MNASKPIQSITLSNTNVTLSGSDQITTFQTLASLLVEKQAAHKRTLDELATMKHNLTIVTTRMGKAEEELASIICPFHTWNCKSRARCSQTARKKLEEKDERIGELEEDMESADRGCYNGRNHGAFYQYQ